MTIIEHPIAYNGTTPDGGDPTMVNLNDYYASGDLAFIIICVPLVWLMVPGVGFFYSGLARRKSALSLLWLTSIALAVTIFQWYFWGFSLGFSKTATNGFIGNLNNFALQRVLGAPSQGSKFIPDLVYAGFQCMFAAVTIALVIGAAAERGRVLPAAIFSFIWLTLVYCPLACWVWNTSGWAYKWGVMDWAGGGPVEISSGVAALAYSLVLGKRKEGTDDLLVYRPHSITSLVLGTAFLWFGWFGFNGGSAFGANLRAMMAIWVTTLCGATGGITWCALDYRLQHKFTMVGFCSGAIAGLVASTPASGFIGPSEAIAVGVVAGIGCNYATKLKYWWGVDDAMDVFAEHGVGGAIGLIMTGLFGSRDIAALDGNYVGVDTGDIPAGWISHVWSALYKQLAYVFAVGAYVFVMTALILYIIDHIPGLHLRIDEDGEMMGIDEAQIGEFCYDYVEERRSYLSWGSPDTDSESQSSKSKPTADATDNKGSATATEEKNEHVIQRGAQATEPASAVLDVQSEDSEQTV